MTILQQESLILPTSYSISGNLADLNDTEPVADALEHTSAEVWVKYLRYIEFKIMAIEVVPVAGAPGNLQCWIELSPFPSANDNIWPSPLPTSALYWAAVGGGGGALPPADPLVEVGIGVNLVTHGILMPIVNNHTPWVRFVCQTTAPHATSYWSIQVQISGKD